MATAPRRRKRLRWNRRVNPLWLGGTIAVLILVPAIVVTLHAIQAPRLSQFLKQRANDLLAEGKTVEGTQYLQLYVRSNPDDMPEALRLAMLWLDSDDPYALYESQQILLRAVRSGDKSPSVRIAALRLHLLMGEKAEALRAARELESIPSLDASAWRLVAEAYDINDQKSDALRAARASIDEDPNDLLSLAMYLPLVMQVSSNPDEMRSETAKRVEDSKDKAMANLVAYTALRNAGLPEASAYLARAVELGPDNVEILLMAARDATDKDPIAAQKYLERVSALAPNDERVDLTFGNWLAWSGRPQEAYDALRRGYQKHGRYFPEFAWRLAEILIEQNQKPDAVSEYLQAVLDSRDYQAAYRFLRGRAEMIKGNLDRAESQLVIAKRLIEQFGMPSQSWSDRDELLFKIDLALAGIAYGQGDYQKAIRLADSAHERMPREFTPLITLGEIYYSLGDLDKSEQAWSEAIDRPFHPPGALLGLLRTRLGQLAELPASQRQFAQLFELLERAKRRIPNDVNLTLLESEVQWMSGQTSEALDTLRAARQLYDRQPIVALSLIRLLIATENYAEAEKQITKFDKDFGPQMASVLSRATLKAQQGEFAESRSILTSHESLFPPPTQATRFRLIGQLDKLLRSNKVAGEKFATACEADPDDDLAWMYRWTWINTAEGSEPSDQAIEQARKKFGDANVRWRWADSIRAYERNVANPALAAPTLAEHAAVLHQNHRQHWATWFVKGLEAEVNDRPEEAIQHYLKAIARGPALPSVTDRAVRLLIRSGATEDAAATLESARTQRFPFVNDQMMMAELDLAKSQKESALAKVRAIKEANYPEAFVMLWTIRMLAKLDHLPEAREQLMEFVKTHPDNLTGWLMDLALTSTNGGKIDPNVTVALLRETSNVTNQHFVAGQIELSAGNLESADKDFDQALSTGKLSESNWRTIIDYLRWRKANNLESVVDRAREAFPSALWLNPPPNS